MPGESFPDTPPDRRGEADPVGRRDPDRDAGAPTEHHHSDDAAEVPHGHLAAAAFAGVADNESVRSAWRKHPVASILTRVVVAVAGVLLGVLIGGHTTADVGPIHVSADLLVGSGDATLRIPPLGALDVDAYKGPFSLQMTVLTVDRAKATAYVNGSKSLDELTAAVESDLQSALTTLLIKTVVWAIVGGGVASLLVFRRTREVLVSIATSIALIALSGAIGYVTFDAKAFQQPKYTGLLEQAPAIVGNVSNLADKFADYRKSLVKLLTNVSTLYTTVSTLPTDPGVADTTKVLHVSDLHMNPAGFDLMSNLVKQFKVDFVIDTGDLVDWGTPQEAATFSTIGALKVPYVYIRGNHDSKTTEAQVAKYPNARVLDQTEAEVDGITIAGVGDPRFSPDRTTYDDSTLNEAAAKAAKEFAAYLEAVPKKPDIVLFHDPGPAKLLKDSGPLILSGHKHKRSVSAVDKDTLLMVQGSTGGAGLRGLEGDKPTPLTASVLYFDSATHKLRAWDDITVGGLGQTDVSINRTLAPQAVQEAEESAASISSSEPSESTSSASSSSRPPSGAQQPASTSAPPTEAATTSGP
ncbi:metallophosphoesterase family protein [Cumulibacter manganitolerans]|uniref:metallophosphoesterase family protein n=1 Tax=Cumulibacter manganitolerans TaxID=1884992 RepID=UPI001295775C|nr:metallophosphoesterase [Cumulibacter manganitolerans]